MTLSQAAAESGRHSPQATAERAVEALVVAVADPVQGRAHHYGLLVSQVHSIVRLGEGEIGSRARKTGEGGWEMVYEGAWIPLLHLRQCLGITDRRTGSNAERMFANRGSVRILVVRSGDAPASPAPAGGAGVLYAGLVVDEVHEIMSCPLAQLLPFPRWVVRDLPAATVWAALPRDDSSLLLLLDGVALAAQQYQR
ncbi:MAG TPA: chemotaxis protein CheW [Chloroflexia bacterium]|jgi:chemotaxis signal transduction protein|nr:chemotaxis protein CheW [Chloroflexia bacterium]